MYSDGGKDSEVNQFFVIEKLDYDCEGRHVIKRDILGVCRSIQKAIEYCGTLCEDLRAYYYHTHLELSDTYTRFIIKKVKDLDQTFAG